MNRPCKTVIFNKPSWVKHLYSWLLTLHLLTSSVNKEIKSVFMLLTFHKQPVLTENAHKLSSHKINRANEASLLWQRSGPHCSTKVHFFKSQENWEKRGSRNKGLQMLRNHLHVNNKNKQVLLFLEMVGASLRVVCALTYHSGFTSACLPVYSWIQQEWCAFYGRVHTASKKHNSQISSITWRQNTHQKPVGTLVSLQNMFWWGKTCNNKAIWLVIVFNISPNVINALILTRSKAGKVNFVLIRGWSNQWLGFENQSSCFEKLVYKIFFLMICSLKRKEEEKKIYLKYVS